MPQGLEKARTAKKPRAAKVASTKSTAKVVTKTDMPKKDRRGTPKGKASGVGRGQGGGGKIGNPPFVPTDEQRIEVCAMIACGTEQAVIADIIGCSVDTLQRHFCAELERGKARLLGRIGGSMFRDALDPNKPNYHDSRKYVLARVGGWKTTTAVESSGPDGGPIVYVNEPPRRDLSHLTEEELLEFERLTGKLEAAGVSSDQ